VRDTQPPVAVAGEDAIVVEGTTIRLNGSASTDNVGIVAYEWKITGGVTTKPRSGEVNAFYFERAGTYTVNLKVFDAAGNFETDAFIVIVKPSRMEWRIGPFLDGKGNPVKGAKVAIVTNGTTYEGKTSPEGFATLTASWHDLIEPVEVTVTKSGWEKIEFSIGLDDEREPEGEIPTMVKKEDESPGPGGALAICALSILAILGRVWRGN
jgi:hypothetical protein